MVTPGHVHMSIKCNTYSTKFGVEILGGLRGSFSNMPSFYLPTIFSSVAE